MILLNKRLNNNKIFSKSDIRNNLLMENFLKTLLKEGSSKNYSNSEYDFPPLVTDVLRESQTLPGAGWDSHTGFELAVGPTCSDILKVFRGDKGSDKGAIICKTRRRTEENVLGEL